MEKDEGYAEKTGWPYVLENAAYNFTGYVKFRLGSFVFYIMSRDAEPSGLEKLVLSRRRYV